MLHIMGFGILLLFVLLLVFFLLFFMALHKFSYDCCFIVGCGFRMSAATTTLLRFLWLSTTATGVEFIANKCL